MDENLYFDITPNGEDRDFILQNPCSLSCETDVGPIRLILDQKQPIFLFIEIDGEMRRCYDLRNHDLRFNTQKEVLSYLEQVRNSEFFDNIVRDEVELNEEWEDL